jgi:hypothetical protein
VLRAAAGIDFMKLLFGQKVFGQKVFGQMSSC